MTVSKVDPMLVVAEQILILIRSHNHLLTGGYVYMFWNLLLTKVHFQGRLYQSILYTVILPWLLLTLWIVEYAMEAISHAGTVLGVLAQDGVVLAAEKKVTGKLLDLSSAKDGGYGGSGEKIYLLNSWVLGLEYRRYCWRTDVDHVFCCPWH